MELQAGLGANGRRHFGRWGARKRRPLIGCVWTRGGAVRAPPARASAARVQVRRALLRLIRIGSDKGASELVTVVE